MIFGLREYVWDRVWKSPAIVVGVDETTGFHTVTEIVLPAQKFGRVARRSEYDLCRYVKLIVPEDEAEVAERLVGFSGDALTNMEKQLCSDFATRTRSARLQRGIVQ